MGGGRHCEGGCRNTGGGEERGGATSREGCGGGPPRGLKESAKPCLAALCGAGGSTGGARVREDSVYTGIRQGVGWVQQTRGVYQPPDRGR